MMFMLDLFREMVKSKFGVYFATISLPFSFNVEYLEE